MGRREALIAALIAGAALAFPAEATVVSMGVNRSGCTDYTSGIGACEVSSRTRVSVTWALDAQESLNGYQFQIRWDPSELTLTGSSQRFPDTLTPVAWTSEPSDPSASVASAFSLPTPAATTLLFQLEFLATPSASDGQQDLWWFPQGAGLSPSSVVLENSSGAGVDFTAAPNDVPALDDWGLAALALGLLGIGGRAGHSRRRSRA